MLKNLVVDILVTMSKSRLALLTTNKQSECPEE